jgi:hypothetical protein
MLLWTLISWPACLLACRPVALPVVLPCADADQESQLRHMQEIAELRRMQVGRTHTLLRLCTACNTILLLYIQYMSLIKLTMLATCHHFAILLVPLSAPPCVHLKLTSPGALLACLPFHPACLPVTPVLLAC